MVTSSSPPWCRSVTKPVPCFSHHAAASDALHSDRILILDFGSQFLLGCDTPGDRYQAPQGFNVMAAVEEPADAERIFNTLAAGGTVTMPVQETFWAHRFGMCTDRFGIPWMVNCAKPLETAGVAGRSAA